MSLLNDALRKKKSERQSGNVPPNAAWPKPGSAVRQSGRRQLWTGIGCLGLLAAAICGVWLYRSASNTPSLLVNTQPPPLGAVRPDNASTMLPESDTTPAAPPAAVSVPTAAAVPETAQPAPAPPLRRPGVPTPAKAQTPTLPKPKPPVNDRADHRPVTNKIASTPKPKASGRPRSTAAPASVARPSNPQRRLQADRLYDKARQYHRRNHLERAIGLYREVLKIAPEYENARFNLGAAYLQTGAFDKAYLILADLYVKEPANQQVMLNLAVAHIGCHRSSEALALLDKASATAEPPLFEIALHKGIAYKQLNQPQKAWNWYKRAEALRPDDPRLLFNLAVVSDQQQHYAAAIHYYRRHIDLSPDMDAAKAKQIRRRIRILQAYHAQQGSKESVPQ